MNVLETLARRLPALLCAAASPGLALAQASAPAQQSPSAAAYAWPLVAIALLVGIRAICAVVSRRLHEGSGGPDRRSPWIPSGDRSPAGSARR
jgi:hypothetical protein